MIQRTYVYTAGDTQPVHNLAVEAYWLETVPEDACILYLWQNARTVVIGRNQNAWQECRVAQLREDGGHLVRRLSGGGAVYHDLGNLNFTFLLRETDYDLSRQQQVILRAVRSFGLDARTTGRNDIEIDGRKFSGNAFYRHGGRAYHHGTLLIQVDTAQMGRYLNVDPQKLAGKGIPSVPARVVNLGELCPRITVQSLCDALITALGEVYGLAPQRIPETALNTQRIRALKEQFGAWDWIYGRRIPFTWRARRRFAWGALEICLQVESGRVRDCACYSDAMDAAKIQRIAGLLAGCPLDAEALRAALAPLGQEDEALAADALALLMEQEF